MFQGMMGQLMMLAQDMDIQFLVWEAVCASPVLYYEGKNTRTRHCALT